MVGTWLRSLPTQEVQAILLTPPQAITHRPAGFQVEVAGRG
jgi:hypothetical protein